MRTTLLWIKKSKRLMKAILPFVFFTISSVAQATYSIVVADKQTRQVGSAVTSCVSGASVAQVFGVVPGIGGINAQAFSNREARDFAVQAFQSDIDARRILDFISSKSYDVRNNFRQYGIVSFDDALAYSGSNNGAFASSITEIDARFNYAIQGNILTGPRVLDQTEQDLKHQLVI